MAARGLWGAILLCSSLPMMVRGGPIRATKDHSSPVRPINDHTVPLVHLRSAAHVKQDQIGPEMATSDHSVPQQDKLGTSKVEEITLYASQNLRNQHDEVADRQCVNDSQCFPSAVLSIPRALVYCDGDTKTCVCNNCFVLINNTCAVERCHRYDNDSGRCQDERKSQKDSLLISVFLSATGAANLYIGQEALGYSQFGLLFLTFFFCCCIYCTKKCFINCCKCFEDECTCYDYCEDFWTCCHELCAYLCLLFSTLAVLLCCVAMAAWWAADIAGFVENTKPDGDGCPLKQDL